MSYIYTKHALKTAVAAAGSHFFDSSTMRFFESQLCEVIPGPPERCYFVTSERGPDRQRRYSVRVFNGSSIETIGGFQKYFTRTRAVAAARALHDSAG